MHPGVSTRHPIMFVLYLSINFSDWSKNEVTANTRIRLAENYRMKVICWRIWQSFASVLRIRVARYWFLVACVRCWGRFAEEIWGEIDRGNYSSCCMNLFRVFVCFIAFLISFLVSVHVCFCTHVARVSKLLIWWINTPVPVLFCLILRK